MKRRSFILAIAAASVTLPGCAATPVYVNAPPGPPHRYYYDYYYYPDVSVYFHLFSGTYWYRDHGAWVNIRALPSHIHLDHRHRKPLVTHDPRPYRHWHDHSKRYRAPRGYRPEPRHDRREREHNARRHHEYRRHRR